MFDMLFKAAASGIQGAITVLLIVYAFAWMIGGRRGAKWVVDTATAPIKLALQKKITALIYLCMFIIVCYYLGSKTASFFGFGR